MCEKCFSGCRVLCYVLFFLFFCSETAKNAPVSFLIIWNLNHSEMFTILGLKIKQMALCLICCNFALSNKCSVVHALQSQLVFTLGLCPVEVYRFSRQHQHCSQLWSVVWSWVHDGVIASCCFLCSWCMFLLMTPFSCVMEPRTCKHTNYPSPWRRTEDSASVAPSLIESIFINNSTTCLITSDSGSY